MRGDSTRFICFPLAVSGAERSARYKGRAGARDRLAAARGRPRTKGKRMTDASETIGIAPERRDELLNKRELAARLKLGFRTLERWQRRGVLPYVKVGNVVRFHWSSVVASLLEYYQGWDKGECRRQKAEVGGQKSEVRGPRGVLTPKHSK